MSRRFSFVLATTVLAAGLAAADEFKREGTGPKRAAKDEIENKPPPLLKVSGWVNSDGKPIKLADLHGKVVVLDFWGVWCGPCRAAMPHLKELYEKHKKDGLMVIGIHTKKGGQKAAEYVREHKLTWPIAVDSDDETVKAFRVDSFPDYYLIDRAGNLRVADLQNGDLDRAVKILLAEKAPAGKSATTETKKNEAAPAVSP